MLGDIEGRVVVAYDEAVEDQAVIAGIEDAVTTAAGSSSNAETEIGQAAVEARELVVQLEGLQAEVLLAREALEEAVGAITYAGATVGNMLGTVLQLHKDINDGAQSAGTTSDELYGDGANIIGRLSVAKDHSAKVVKYLTPALEDEHPAPLAAQHDQDLEELQGLAAGAREAATNTYLGALAAAGSADQLRADAAQSEANINNLMSFFAPAMDMIDETASRVSLLYETARHIEETVNSLPQDAKSVAADMGKLREDRDHVAKQVEEIVRALKERLNRWGYNV